MKVHESDLGSKVNRECKKGDTKARLTANDHGDVETETGGDNGGEGDH